MRKFLLASHAYLAKGMKSSLELILGEQECVDVLCAYTDEQYDIKVEIEKKLTALQPEDELIVITDLFGGSVNNEFTSLLTNTDKKMNLALVMNLVVNKDEDADLESMIKDCIEESKGMMIYCNDLLKQEDVVDEDDF